MSHASYITAHVATDNDTDIAPFFPQVNFDRYTTGAEVVNAWRDYATRISLSPSTVRLLDVSVYCGDIEHELTLPDNTSLADTYVEPYIGTFLDIVGEKCINLNDYTKPDVALMSMTELLERASIASRMVSANPHYVPCLSDYNCYMNELERRIESSKKE